MGQKNDAALRSIRSRMKCAPLFVALAAFLLTAIGPAQARVPAGCGHKIGPPIIDFTQPPNLDFVKQALIYYRCTRYDNDIARVLRKAQQWVAKRAKQVRKPAIVLDIDETALSNWTRIYRDDFAYIQNGPCDLSKKHQACGDKAWQRMAKAPAILPTLKLYRFARCIDVVSPCVKIAVFFVTGRHESRREYDGETPRQWTLDNLRNAHFAGVESNRLYMRPADSRGPVSKFKTNARKNIEKLGFDIIANIGDQESDLKGGYAERTFKVPNPFYFIP